MKRLLLIMRAQDVDPESVLTGTDVYPGEYMWGYRPLCDLFGKEHMGVLCVDAGHKSMNVLLLACSTITTRILGDMRIIPSLAFQLWRQRREIEAVFITANSAVFTVLILKILGCGFRVYPVLLGWPEFKFPRMSRLKRWAWLVLLRSADSVLALGIEEHEVLKLHGLDNVRHLTFGVDTHFWAPANDSEKDFIFSVGADPNRDFETLLSAKLDMPILLCAPSDIVKRLSLVKNVTTVQGSYSEVRKWFQEAKVVVIPVLDTIRPSGQGCILQAMASGKAVVTNRTKGRWTDKLIDGENCLLVPPGDPEALHQAVARVYADSQLAAKLGRSARDTVLEHFTVSHYARSLAAATAR